MTGANVEHTKALEEAATPGPWEIIGGNEYLTGVDIGVGSPEGIGDADAEFIAHARTAVPALVAEVETLRERVRRDEPSMPAEYNGGFGGCTDRNPDVCACGQDTDEECSICGEVMESGEMCQMLTRAVHPGLPNHHRDQDWEHIVWHADCATKAQAEADEAQKQFEEWIGGNSDL